MAGHDRGSGRRGGIGLGGLSAKPGRRVKVELPLAGPTRYSVTIGSDQGHIMVEQVSKSQFKAKALEFFRQVEASGTPIVITDNGRPTLEIRRYQQPSRDPFEVLRGSVLRYDDPTAPVGEDDWDMLK